jgi:hypothetical protein
MGANQAFGNVVESIHPGSQYRMSYESSVSLDKSVSAESRMAIARFDVGFFLDVSHLVVLSCSRKKQVLLFMQLRSFPIHILWSGPGVIPSSYHKSSRV